MLNIHLFTKYCLYSSCKIVKNYGKTYLNHAIINKYSQITFTPDF